MNHQKHASENTRSSSLRQGADPTDNAFSPGVVNALAQAYMYMMSSLIFLCSKRGVIKRKMMPFNPITDG